jgi:hypothetical protein
MSSRTMPMRHKRHDVPQQADLFAAPPPAPAPPRAKVAPKVEIRQDELFVEPADNRTTTRRTTGMC